MMVIFKILHVFSNTSLWLTERVISSHNITGTLSVHQANTARASTYIRKILRNIYWLCIKCNWFQKRYCQTSNIRHTKSKNLNVSHLVLQLSLPNLVNHWLSRGWRCSWSSVDRRCSNYIWLIINFIAYWGASSIRCLTILGHVTWQPLLGLLSW